MKQLKIFLLAFVGCIMLTACPSDIGEDIPDVPTNGSENTEGNSSTGIEDIHNGTSSKPAYAPMK